jgi:hypothetical protein
MRCCSGLSAGVALLLALAAYAGRQEDAAEARGFPALSAGVLVEVDQANLRFLL